MLKTLLICSALVFVAGRLVSQDESIGYGFRAGISLSQYDGPSELGPNGETLETNKGSNGFHIGMALNYKFGDLAGMRGELLYSQRGTDYVYEGPSYFVLDGVIGPDIKLGGTRKQTVSVSNAYIDVPITFYYKFKGFELSGGLNTGFLINSVGGGGLEYNGITPPPGGPDIPFTINLNYNYKSDDGGSFELPLQQVTVSGKQYAIPSSLGAYYDFPERDKDMFQTFDFGLIGGLSYYLNEGLFFGVRYVYGLGDVDRNEYDISLKDLNPDGTFIQRSDVNKSKSWQFSVGFSF